MKTTFVFPPRESTGVVTFTLQRPTAEQIKEVALKTKYLFNLWICDPKKDSDLQCAAFLAKNDEEAMEIAKKVIPEDKHSFIELEKRDKLLKSTLLSVSQEAVDYFLNQKFDEGVSANIIVT